jgi:hypothetical protein
MIKEIERLSIAGNYVSDQRVREDLEQLYEKQCEIIRVVNALLENHPKVNSELERTSNF